jgi:2-aminoadipate transaminase
MKLCDIQLSEYGKLSSTPSPINRMMAEFAANFRPDIDINLGVGYVNENTIPREYICDAMRDIIDKPEKYPLALNYGGSKGSSNLINSIRRFYTDNTVGMLSEETLSGKEIIIGPNGATSLLESIASVIEPGIVITTDPMYYIYCNFLERRGFDILAVPEDNEGIRTDVLERKIRGLGDKIGTLRYAYIVTVSNPTGTILSNSRRAELVGIVSDVANRLGRPVPVIFDKAYEDLIHDETVPKPESGFLYDTNNLVYEIGTLSKLLAPALRIGYMIGSDAPFMRSMVQKTSDAGFSAPQITQEIAGYLLDNHVSKQIEFINSGYRSKAAAIKARIDEKLGGDIESCSGGQAGFYFYLTLNGIETTENSPFFKFLTRTTGDPAVDGPENGTYPRVIYIPGEFCVHSAGDMVDAGKRQLRLSYGFEETDRILSAIDHIKEAVEYAKDIRQ